MTEPPIHRHLETPQTKRRSASGVDLKALIVDDDPGSLAFAAEALHSFVPGFEVATARDRDQALAWLETFRPDVVLLDRKFAQERETGILQRARDGAGGRRVRILVMTETGGPDTAPGEIELAVDGRLTKPLGLAALLDAVRRSLREGDGH